MNTKDLQIIKNADFSGDTHTDKVCREMRDIVEQRSDGFTNSDNFSDTKIDMTDIIKQYGYDVELYKKKFGSVQRSEVDAVKHLIELAKDKGGKPSTPEKISTTDDERVRIAEAEAEAVDLLLMLELEL